MKGSMAVMAKHMVHSVSTSPHFLIVDEADMSETLAVYKKTHQCQPNTFFFKLLF